MEVDAREIINEIKLLVFNLKKKYIFLNAH